MTIQSTATAFVKGKQASCHNSRTDGQTYWLHGHPIARKIEGGSVIVSWCGWYTRTTASHLNAVAKAYGSNERFSYAQAREEGMQNAML